MTYGLQVFNSSGYVQIGESYSNCGLAQSGSALTGATISINGGEDGTLVFVRIPYGKSICRKGGVQTYQFSAAPGPYGSADYTYEYRIYKRLTGPVPSSGFGLQVYDSSAGLTFDSNLLYARLTAAVALNAVDINSQATIPSNGQQPWILLDPLGNFALIDSGNPNVTLNYSICATLNMDGSVTVQPLYVGLGPGIGGGMIISGTRTILIAK